MKPFPITPSDARPMVLTQGGVDRPPFMGMGRRFLRGVTAIVIAAIVNTSLAPLVSAAQLKRSQAATLKASTSDEQSYADALQAIYAQASRTVNPNARAPAPDLGNPDTLQTYADNIQAQWDALRAQWRAGRFSLSKKLRFCAKLPANRACGPVRRVRRPSAVASLYTPRH